MIIVHVEEKCIYKWSARLYNSNIKYVVCAVSNLKCKGRILNESEN